MSSRHERRAAALEAIAHALLELAALEREPDEIAPKEILIDRRNCERELGLSPRAFAAAASRSDFAAFRVSKRLTATKADVLAWLKSRKVEPRPHHEKPLSTQPQDPDGFLKEIHGRFAARVGRAMTDEELDHAECCVMAGQAIAAKVGREYTDTADQVAARVQSKIGLEPSRHSRWRALGVDPIALERDAEELRHKLFTEQPELGWRDRVRAVYELWDSVTGPLEEARREARAAARAAKKAEKAKRGELGLKR